MLRARIAMSVGLTLVLFGFAVGTSATSASLDGARVTCDSVLDVRWFPFAETAPDVSQPPPSTRPHEQRVKAACDAGTLPMRLMTWGGPGLGGLVALIGWTALRERGTAGARVVAGDARSRRAGE